MKRVFLSFRAEDRKQVNGLRLLAANDRFEVQVCDESVRTPYDSNDPAYIRRKIREKVRRTTITVCLLRALTRTSKWVSWELEESIDKGNEIILMGLPGVTEALTLPVPVKRLGLRWYTCDLDWLTREINRP